MLKLVTSSEAGQTLWLGLTRDNLDRLPLNEPIMFDWSEVGSPPDVVKVVIFAGETTEDLMEDLRALGVPL